MAGDTWSIEGQRMETCNCSLLCPCITSNLAALPTEGDCKAALAMRIDKGWIHFSSATPRLMANASMGVL